MKGENEMIRIPPGRLAGALVTAGLALAAPDAARAQTLFKSLTVAVGVETDTSGNVYTSNTVVSGLSSTVYIGKYSAAGALQKRVKVPGSTSTDSPGRIHRIGTTNEFLYLDPKGKIFRFDQTLAPTLLLDLSPLAGQVAAQVFDVSTNTFRNVGLISPRWGDITSRLVTSSRLYVYVTAQVNANVTPVVVRLYFDLASGNVFWRGIATTLGTTAGNTNLNRGIAVNNLGWVLTTLPATGNLGFFDGLVAFHSNFPETTTTAVRPRFVFRSSTGRILDVASRGMSTDATNRFYIATGTIGSSTCGVSGSGAMMVVRADPRVPAPRCFNLGGLVRNSVDVGVNPVNGTSYMTVSAASGGGVYRFPVVPATTPALSAEAREATDDTQVEGAVETVFARGVGLQGTFALYAQ
jgi:hypothetical protein